MMRHKVVLWPLYHDTLAVVTTMVQQAGDSQEITRHFTLKTSRARDWEVSSLLRELADRLDSENP